MNTKTTAGNGSGWPRRWWERMFAGVLILIAVIAAVLLFLVMSRGYCECRTWGDWTAGVGCEGCAPSAQNSDWNQDALLYCRKQLAFGYGGASEVSDLPGASQWPAVHERYFVYQSPSAQEVYFFLAVQASSYGDASLGVQGSAVKLDVMRAEMGSPWNPIPVSCSGPRLISEASSSSVGDSGARTWGWYCRVSSPQGGFPGPGGFSGYRVFIKNVSPQPLRYCYVAVCDRKYPRNDKCTDPAVALQIQTTPSPRGYPASPSYSPPYPSSPYPGASPSSAYPTSRGPTSSSPPPSSTGGAGQ